ncbi:Na+/H+ antiporter subunit E [Luteipulveratus flavus]|uniref:Na+/H+ antiporter subunit E n=1 Tax=Luteipulveratus flavus TaxID=3031728 RepID=A0ABT6CDP1_9MICO|nr:Na+/H+ antiporter subunit E [Luteipulveratus sp. YIM 133296]MDF8266537.1 Na+/H+ antiporter subunit E [Luteipulveratus sp. YIM 133296]
MIRRRVQPFPLLWLTLVWVLLWGNVSWANVLGGLALGFVILMVFPLPRLSVGMTFRPVWFAVLLGHFVVDLVRASVTVAWLAVRPGRPANGVVFDVRLRGRDELLQSVTAEMVALVPGTVVIDLEPASGAMTIHALDVHDLDGARRIHRQILGQEDRVLRALATDVPGPTTEERT